MKGYVCHNNDTSQLMPGILPGEMIHVGPSSGYLFYRLHPHLRWIVCQFLVLLPLGHIQWHPYCTWNLVSSYESSLRQWTHVWQSRNPRLTGSVHSSTCVCSLDPPLQPSMEHDFCFFYQHTKQPKKQIEPLLLRQNHMGFGQVSTGESSFPPSDWSVVGNPSAAASHPSWCHDASVAWRCGV